jgi:hypothetical protein
VQVFICDIRKTRKKMFTLICQAVMRAKIIEYLMDGKGSRPD